MNKTECSGWCHQWANEKEEGGKKQEDALTWSFHLCPGQAPASCSEWWWGAGVRPKCWRLSSYELLIYERRHRGKKQTLLNKSILKWKLALTRYCGSQKKNSKKEFSPVLLYVERLKEGWRGVLAAALRLSWLLQLFHGPLLICSLLYSGAEERSLRWLPRHTNLSMSSVSLNPLVSFRLSPLNVFDCTKNPHLSVKSFYFRCHDQTWPLTLTNKYCV